MLVYRVITKVVSQQVTNLIGYVIIDYVPAHLYLVQLIKTRKGIII